MKIEANNKLLIVGDSITDCGRTQPVGEGLFNPYGSGWVNVVVGLLGAFYPERRIRVVNMGTSGNTVRDLDARWQRDVFDQRPDWVAILIGINDVWRQMDSPLQVEQHVGLAEYRATLDRLVAATLPKVQSLVLMTPYYVEPNAADTMRATMDRYGVAVREIANDRRTLFVDTQAAFDGLLANYHSSYLCWDRVHPSIIGHTAIARAFLDAVGFQWGGEH